MGDDLASPALGTPSGPGVTASATGPSAGTVCPVGWNCQFSPFGKFESRRGDGVESLSQKSNAQTIHVYTSANCTFSASRKLKCVNIHRRPTLFVVTNAF